MICKFCLKMDNPELMKETKGRNKEESIFNILKIVFQEKATNEMLGLFDKLKMPLDEIIYGLKKYSKCLFRRGIS